MGSSHGYWNRLHETPNGLIVIMAFLQGDPVDMGKAEVIEPFAAKTAHKVAVSSKSNTHEI